MQRLPRTACHEPSLAAMTLIEVMLVIALIATSYSMFAPALRSLGGGDEISEVNRLAMAIRTAYDHAVLYQRQVRLRIVPASGEYWLEEPVGSGRNLWPDPDRGEDLSSDELREEQETFDAKFEAYQALLGEPVTDPKDSEKSHPIRSPVLQAKSRLRPLGWTRVTSPAWVRTRLSTRLLIAWARVAHLNRTVEAVADGDQLQLDIYFEPEGRAEPAMLAIFPRRGELEHDDQGSSYFLLIRPETGVTTISYNRYDWQEYQNKIESGEPFVAESA